MPYDPEVETEFSRLREHFGAAATLNYRAATAVDTATPLCRSTWTPVKDYNGLLVLGCNDEEGVFYEDFVRMSEVKRSKSLD